MNEKVTLYFILSLASLSLVYFIFLISSLVSPLLVFFFILLLLYPFRDNFYASRLLWISWIGFSLWFFNYVYDLIFPFIIAFVLAYLFEPIVQFLTRFKVSRNIAAVIITVFGIGAIILFIVLFLPLVIDQLSRIGLFLKTIPFTSMISLVPLDLLNDIGVSRSEIESVLINFFSAKISTMGSLITTFLSNFPTNISYVVSFIINIIVIPFLSLYFLSDFPLIVKTINSLVPKNYYERYNEFATLANRILRQYFRGQLIIVIILLLIYSATFWVFDIPYPFLLGLIFGTLSFIPYIGGIISLLISFIFSLLSNDPFTIFLSILIIYSLIHALENFFLVPRIIGKTVDLNPIILFLSIFLFGRFLGFVGILLAVPLSAFLVAILKKYYISGNLTKIQNS